MNIFLTGATGFVGSHVARRLITNGHTVSALIRPGSNTWRIDDLGDSLRAVAGDLSRPEGLREPLQRIRPEVCVHCAWQIEPKKYLNSLENLHCLAFSWQLAQQLADLGCPWMVGVGTSLEYGQAVGRIAETSPASPRGLYGACKLALCFALEQLCRTRGMRFTWLRLFYPYGPGDYDWRLIPQVIGCLLRGEPAPVTTGRQRSDFLYIEDMAAAIGEVIRGNLEGIVNIGSGTPVTVQAVVQTIGRLTGRQHLIEWGAKDCPPYESMFICADNQRLVKNTSWKPQYSLEQGLKQTIAWWQSRRDNETGKNPRAGQKATIRTM